MIRQRFVCVVLTAAIALGTTVFGIAGLGAFGAGAAFAASSVQDKALKDGCKQRYATNKKKYKACVAGNTKSNDAQIDGCYARYQHQRDKLKQCLGR